jgi:hypothetical protein
LNGKANGSLKKPVQNPREAAEIVAIQALNFIAGDTGRLGSFLAETGIGPETLRKSAADPQFLASVLDFVLRDDASVKAFAKASELPPTTIAAARQALGDALGDPQWERDVP